MKIFFNASYEWTELIVKALWFFSCLICSFVSCSFSSWFTAYSSIFPKISNCIRYSGTIVLTKIANTKKNTHPVSSTEHFHYIAFEILLFSVSINCFGFNVHLIHLFYHFQVFISNFTNNNHYADAIRNAHNTFLY